MNRTISRAAVVFALCATFLFAFCKMSAQDTIPFFQAGKIRVLIFSGRNNHDWRTHAFPAKGSGGQRSV